MTLSLEVLTFTYLTVGILEEGEDLNKDAGLLKRLELLFHTKTHHCRHTSPDCVTNAVKGFISNFKIGIKIRVAFTLLQVLLRGGKLNKIKLLDQLRFPMFLSTFAFVAKLVLCVLRRVRGKDDGWNGFASGALAGLSLLIHNDKGTRKLFALYLLSRAYGATYNSMDSRKVVPQAKNQHLIFMTMVNVIFYWLYFFEFKHCKVSQSYWAAVNNTYQVFKEPNDRLMRDLMQQKLAFTHLKK